MSAPYRAGLPPLPERMRGLPISDKGYPVPFFVQWVDGKPDFRVMDETKLVRAMRLHLCWICGKPLGRHVAYNVGPTCVLNRLSGEPPAHRECAEYAVVACPFLALPKARRREAGLTSEQLAADGGAMIKDNPGIAAIYFVEARPRVNRHGFLQMGEPTAIHWYCEGRTATAEEISQAVEVALARQVGAVGYALMHNRAQQWLKQGAQA